MWVFIAILFMLQQAAPFTSKTFNDAPVAASSRSWLAAGLEMFMERLYLALRISDSEIITHSIVLEDLGVAFRELRPGRRHGTSVAVLM